MIIGSKFPGDENLMVMRLQHDVYWGMMSAMFFSARDRYLAAARLLGVDDELSTRIRDIDLIDHRVLQDAHDRVAAYFRYTHRDLLQLDLLDSEKATKDRIADEWCTYYRRQCQILAESDHTARAILNAIVNTNTEPGYQAEKELLRLLTDRYPLPEGGEVPGDHI